jgi:PTS system nitrogen regulatory IIA component
MKLEDYFSPADVVLDLRCAAKTQVLQELAARAGARLRLAPAQIAGALLKREELGSTGVGGGIAIPHAPLSGLAKPFGLLARLKRPIDFQAIDALPVDIIFLLLQPAAALGDLNALATVARKLRESDRVKRMREAKDRAQLYDALAQ